MDIAPPKSLHKPTATKSLEVKREVVVVEEGVEVEVDAKDSSSSSKGNSLKEARRKAKVSGSRLISIGQTQLHQSDPATEMGHTTRRLLTSQHPPETHVHAEIMNTSDTSFTSPPPLFTSSSPEDSPSPQAFTS